MMRFAHPCFAVFSFFRSSAALVAFTALASACGGKVVVDSETSGGSNSSGSGSSSSGGGLMCGDEPAEGKIVAVCVSMEGDFCPPGATTPGLLETLAEVMGVCAETSTEACCDRPALRQVVCDLPPVGDECCYHVHYLENVVCP